MKSIALLLLMCFFTTTASAQKLTIKGSIKLEESTPSATYEVEILGSTNKKTILVRKSFNAPDFELELPKNIQCTVRLTASGYSKIDILLERNNVPIIDLGEVYLKLNSTKLDSVIVTARRPSVQIRGSKMTIDVKNTVLSDMGSVMDMLSNTPGLKTGNNGVEVPGKGTPLFIVDGREIKQIDMLDILKSDNVESVEIDRAPSAAYSANTRAIVRIKTIRGIKDYIFLKANNIFSVKRKVSETPSLDFRFKKGAISSYMSYMYSNGGYLIKETYFREIYHSDYTFTSSSKREIPDRYQSHKFIWSTDFDINKKNRLGLVYYFYHNGDNEDNLGNTTLTDATNEIQKYLDQSTFTNSNTHSVSLSYNLDVSKNSKFSFVGDYATVHNNSYMQSKETNLATQVYTDIRTIGKSRYDVYTATSRYDFKLPYNIQSQIGGKYSYVTTPSTTTSDNPYLNGGNYQNHTDMDDSNAAGFFSASKDWKKFSLQLGLRYEDVTTKVTTQSNEEKKQASRRYSDFFPNAQVSYTLNKDWNFGLSYSRSTSRPGYYSLNSSSIYKDSLSYDVGNTTIRPSFTNDFSLYADWKGWSLSISYTEMKDGIMQALICKDENSNITYSVPLNSSTSKEFSSGLSYRKNSKKFDFYGSLRVLIPHMKYPFMNETVTANMLSWETQLNATYYLNKKITFYTNFEYDSRKESMNMFKRSVNQWNIGARGKFLKDRLTMDLRVMDLLHGSNYNNLYDSYLNIKDGTRGTNDFRGVKLILSYIIFKNDIKVKAQRENEEVLMRTSK